jgi:chromosome segregation ATPase
MISLEQVRALEDRVEKAVAYIATLRANGAELERRLAEAQSFIDEAAKELAASEEKSQAAEAKLSEAEAKAGAVASKVVELEARRAALETQRQAESAHIREVESRLADMSERVAAAETRAAELSSRAEEYRKDQAKIEEGIVHALARLDSFEDLMLGGMVTKSAPESVGNPEPAEAKLVDAKKEEAQESDEGLPSESAIEDLGPASPENELDIF